MGVMKWIRSKSKESGEPSPRFSLPFAIALFVILLGSAQPGYAKNHLWRFTEFFSNADGTIQFIEMQECCGSNAEVKMASTSIESDSASFAFPNDLPGPTAFHWILIATQDFAALPGAPSPDYIMPDAFFDPAGDTLRYRGMTDLVVLTPGSLPVDGVNALDRNLTTGDLTVAINSPINFAGESGSVGLPVAVPMVGRIFPVLVIALFGVLHVLGRRTRPQRAPA